MRGIDGSRGADASGPALDLDQMIRAYLDLLKLCLCDLAGAGTTSGTGQPGGGVKWRELGPSEVGVRIEGRDWPRHGLTMGGLLKLDDLQRCVETIVRDGVPGDLIELGTWRGGSSVLMRATLDCLSAQDRTVWMADSFQGFPEHVPGTERAYARTLEPFLAAFEYLVAPLDEVKQSAARLGLADGLRFVPGFFADTVPGLVGERWSLVRLDADTYDPTMLILEHLYPGLNVGGYVVIDDYGALEECRAAVDGFRSDHEITEPIEQVDWCCVRWRKQREI